MKQGEQRGLSSPGLEQPQVLPEMSFYITQRREHCTAALAFSIFSVTRALHSIWDLVASSLVPEVGGKQHGRMVCGCARVPPHAPRQVLTHQRVLWEQVREVHGELVPGLLQGCSLSPLELLAPWGSWPCSPPHSQGPQH